MPLCKCRKRRKSLFRNEETDDFVLASEEIRIYGMEDPAQLLLLTASDDVLML